MIDQLGNGLLLGIIISVASVALSLLYGVTRIVNFAHGEVIALGAIVTLFFSGYEVIDPSIRPTCWSPGSLIRSLFVTAL